jgi:nucleotide-binding universal stress UspA family protein
MADLLAPTPATALLCLSGLDSDAFLDHALRRLPGPGWRFVLLYVVDTRPTEELGYLRQSLFRGRLAPERLAEITSVEDSTAAEVMAEAQAHLLAGRPGAQVATRLARGRPEQEIIAAAQALPADVLVVGVRHRGPHPPPAGPASIGHVARYVLDHAPCDVLLLR